MSDFYTKSELSEYSFFPSPPPEAYIKLGNSTTYMLDYIYAGMPLYTIKRQIARYAEHYETDEWHEIGKDYPKLLFVCSSPAIERLVQRQVNEIGIGDLEAFTTTAKAIANAQSSKDEIWSDVFEPDAPKSLL